MFITMVWQVSWLFPEKLPSHLPWHVARHAGNSGRRVADFSSECPDGHGIYSSGHCSGFSPDSLLIPADDSARKTNNGTKILFFSVHYLHFRKNSDHQVQKQYFMSFRNADKNTRPKKLENTCENILRIVVIFWKHTPIRTRRPRRVSGPTYSLL